MAKKKIPTFSTEDFKVDFLKDDNVIMDSVNRSEANIETFHQEKEEKRNIKKSEKKESGIKENKRIELKKPSVRQKINQNPTTEFINYLSENNGRGATRPVRIKTTTCNRMEKLRENLGGNKSLPEIVDWILITFLDQAEEQIEKMLSDQDQDTTNE